MLYIFMGFVFGYVILDKFIRLVEKKAKRRK